MTGCLVLVVFREEAKQGGATDSHQLRPLWLGTVRCFVHWCQLDSAARGTARTWLIKKRARKSRSRDSSACEDFGSRTSL